MEIFQNLNDVGLTIFSLPMNTNIAQSAKRGLVFRDGRIRKDDPVLNQPRGAQVLKHCRHLKIRRARLEMPEVTAL
jgi:hypothetical protein